MLATMTTKPPWISVMSEQLFKASQWREAKSCHHKANPSPGDYWYEDMLVPILVVVAVTDRYITVFQKTKPTSDNTWTWDVDKPSILSREQFEETLKCGHVGSSQMFWAVDEFNGKPVAIE